MPPAQAIFEFFITFLMPTGYDYVDNKDLRPTWTALNEFVDRTWYWLRKNRKGGSLK
jgi:hypothetical protein